MREDASPTTYYVAFSFVSLCGPAISALFFFGGVLHFDHQSNFLFLGFAIVALAIMVPLPLLTGLVTMNALTRLAQCKNISALPAGTVASLLCANCLATFGGVVTYIAAFAYFAAKS